MDDGRPLDERLDAVERAVTDGHAADGLPDAARLQTRVDDLETTVGEVDDRLAELEAAVQALRGFAGGVRAVDESVERRANAAVARVERLETELREAGVTGADGRPASGSDDGRSANASARHTRRSNGTAEATGDPSRSEGGPQSPTTPSDATLAETAAARARSEAESLDADAVTDDGAEESTDRSLAERIRRLL